jgi:hypothetical protein
MRRIALILFSVLMIASMVGTSAFNWGPPQLPPKPPIGQPPPQYNPPPKQDNFQWMQPWYWRFARPGQQTLSWTVSYIEKCKQGWQWQWSDKNKKNGRCEKVPVVVKHLTGKCNVGFQSPFIGVKTPTDYRHLPKTVTKNCIPIKGFKFPKGFNFGFGHFNFARG